MIRGIVLDRSFSSKIDLRELESNSLNTGQVRIQIKAAALNHRDEWCRQGLYPNISDGVVLGSDGAGIIIETGEGVSDYQIGQEVIINPAIDWGENPKVQSADFQILGMPSNGTLAEKLIVSSDRLHLKPSHLTWEEAAALPLAGLTAFRALVTQGKIAAKDQVLVTGFGGGVAQFAAQFAHALGAKVYVSSSQDSKIEKALSLGMAGGFNYRSEDWVSNALEKTGGFDLIIDGASGDALNDLIKVAKPGGRIVIYGATLGNPSKLEARRIFWNQLQILGTTMGSDVDFANMLRLVEDKNIRPVVDGIFKFEEAVRAFDRMKAGQQLGKIILVP